MTEFAASGQRLTRIAFAATATLALAGTALGDIKFPNVTLEFFSSIDGPAKSMFHLYEDSQIKQQVDDDVYLFKGNASGTGNKWGLEWSMMVSPTSNGGNTATGSGGTFINLANLAVTNTTGSNQTFFVLVTMAIDDPITRPTLMKGDVAASIQSFTGQGATLTNITSGKFAGDPIYEALIDGVSVASLMNNTTITSTGSATASATDAFGQGEGNELIGPPALNTIAIWLKIEVTKHSIATVIGQFEVRPIPAPAALPLLALGALASRRRRRN